MIPKIDPSIGRSPPSGRPRGERMIDFRKV
jgi:hypothetical protein